MGTPGTPQWNTDKVGVFRFVIRSQDATSQSKDGSKVFANAAELAQVYNNMGISVSAVAAANSGRDVTNKVFVGDDLYIPGYYYILQQGDDPSKIIAAAALGTKSFFVANRAKYGTDDSTSPAWKSMQPGDLIRVPTTQTFNSGNVPAALKTGLVLQYPPTGKINL